MIQLKIVSDSHIIIKISQTTSSQSMENGNNIKLSKPGRHFKIKLRKPRLSSWTVEEQTSYVQFLKNNSHLMKNQESRRANKMFKRMSAAIETRTSIQAKTHHQKLEQKYQTCSSIINQIGLFIKRTHLFEAQRKVIETQKLQQEGSTLNCPFSTRLSLEDNSIEDHIQSQIKQLSFFDDDNKQYDCIDWEFMMNQQQPLI